jgi:hypothetical protein
MANEQVPASGESQLLSFQSMSFPTVLGVVSGFQAIAPIAYVIGLGVVGAGAILAFDTYRTELPKEPTERLKWWFARLLVWVFNTAVVIGSVVFLARNGT